MLLIISVYDLCIQLVPLQKYPIFIYPLKEFKGDRSHFRYTAMSYVSLKNNYDNYAKVDDLNWEGGTYWTISDGRKFYYNKLHKQNGIIAENLLITNSEFSKHF